MLRRSMLPEMDLQLIIWFGVSCVEWYRCLITSTTTPQALCTPRNIIGQPSERDCCVCVGGELNWSHSHGYNFNRLCWRLTLSMPLGTNTHEPSHSLHKTISQSHQYLAVTHCSVVSFCAAVTVADHVLIILLLNVLMNSCSGKMHNLCDILS